jgi:5-methylcytosine-specific restriction protein B
MNSSLNKQIYEELRAAVERGLATGALTAATQIERQLTVFRERFGPEVLRKLDGEAALQLMHGRQHTESRCLAYWLEFKDDDEFAGKSFGLIGGGSAYMYGLYQRQDDGAWIGGSTRLPKVLSREEAITAARQQRDELVAGSSVLAALDTRDTSDSAYSQLQSAMDAAAPKLAGVGWAHKYWFLLHSDRLDDFHSPRYQRFHLFKLLQMPPDNLGVRDGDAPRFLCAGRFLTIARELGVPVTTLDTILNQRGPFHNYWRIGTTSGDNGESQWPAMRDGNCVAIGWRDYVPNLSGLMGDRKAKDKVRDQLLPLYHSDAKMAGRKAGEILNFAQVMAENDTVLACEGQTVRGVGRIRGPYDYDPEQFFPHKRPVEWLLLDEWEMPQQEGLRTTVMQLGKSGENLLELERRSTPGNNSTAPKPLHARGASRLFWIWTP